MHQDVFCPHDQAGRHTWQQPDMEIDSACRCGVVLCGSTSPRKGVLDALCNLPKGHYGPCECTWQPELGTWQKQEANQMANRELVRA